MRYEIENLETKSSAEIVEIFREIPYGVTTLDLEYSQIYRKKSQELIPAFVIIPDSVIAVIMDNNAVHVMDPGVISILNAFPQQITSLSLIGNELFKLRRYLGHFFAAIPSGVKSLNLNNNNLGYLSTAGLINGLSKLPSGLTSLDLKNNKIFQSHTTVEVGQIFKAIPAGLTSLDLRGNENSRNTGSQLGLAFANLPRGLTSLYLGPNPTGWKILELAKMYKTLPPSLTLFCVGRNALFGQTELELSQAFSALPQGLTSLGLRSNPLFFDKTSAQLSQVFQNLNRNIVSLDLSLNKLSRKSAIELSGIFQALPNDLKSLNLSNNLLGGVTTADLVLAFAKLPLSLTSINLASNKLIGHAKGDLLTILKALPHGIKELDLSDNDLFFQGEYTYLKEVPLNVTTLHLNNIHMFHRYPVNTLAKIFSALPPGVTSLHLRNNNLYYFSGKNLGEVLQQLSVGVKHLDLRNNGLYQYKNIISLVKLVRRLPQTLTSLDLADNGLSSKKTEELVKVFHALPGTIKKITLSLVDIKSRPEAEIIALAKALPCVMEVDFCDMEGAVVNDKSVELFKQNVGGWIKTSFLGLSDLDLPDVISNLIIKKEIGGDENSLKSFTADLILKRKNQREHELRHFSVQLAGIQSKAEELESRECDAAFHAANKLYDSLSELKDKYCLGKIEYAGFKNDSLAAIAVAKPELKMHRGWGEILTNVILCILGLGIGYLAVCAIKGGFFRVKTDSEIKLEELEAGFAMKSLN